MNRIFGDHVYGPMPRAGCYWDKTCPLPEFPKLQESLNCDVAIIGAGYTGLNAAISLAHTGARVVVVDAEYPGWGASGRNGGFCCLGGSMLTDKTIDHRFGSQARRQWRALELEAVKYVEGLIDDHKLQVDRHSEGETWLAHHARYAKDLKADCQQIEESYGVEATPHSQTDLERLGMHAGFAGGLTTKAGFALNPRKYLAGLLRVAIDAGVRFFSQTPIQSCARSKGGWLLVHDNGRIDATQVLIATNGYSSENLPNWAAGRYLPAQSSIIVTRPLTQQEMSAQGWTSHQMCYDARELLHYFRLMPNGRFLFGMRGGLGGTLSSENRARRRVIRSFHRMFPKWHHIDITHYWSGMVCLTRELRPFVGEIDSGLYAAFGYHGNGVAMSSYLGSVVGEMMGGKDPHDFLAFLMKAPRQFPLGRFRRLLMPPAYAAMAIRDL